MKQFNYDGWINLATLQSKEILTELIDCKETPRASLIISDTGLGKTHTVQTFCKKHKEHTYLVTAGDSLKLRDIIDKIMQQLGIEHGYKTRAQHWGYQLQHTKLMLIADRFRELSEAGHKPVLVIDEFENARLTTMKMIKELYDFIIPYCSIVLIGTSQILDIMTKGTRNGQSIPQLYRRFKAGIRHVSPIKKARDFKPFFDMYLAGCPEVQDILLDLCENYGELHDYIDIAMRFCKKTGKQLDAQLFRMIHKLPNSYKPKNFINATANVN